MLNKRTYQIIRTRQKLSEKSKRKIVKPIELSETEKQTLFNEHLKFIELLRVKNKVYKSPCRSYLIGT
jgi:hypothetical protein